MNIFEIIDATDDEAYYPIGLFTSLEDALAAIESKPRPWELCENAMFHGESATIEIRKRKIGIATLESGQIVWEKTWVNKYNEDEDDNLWEESK
jgi:hypothetical protein